jgi:hypothetical protein
VRIDIPDQPKIESVVENKRTLIVKTIDKLAVEYFASPEKNNLHLLKSQI